MPDTSSDPYQVEAALVKLDELLDDLYYLASLLTGELRYQSFELNEARMIVLGSDVVLVSGQIQIILGGTRKRLDNVYIDVWARREGQWRIVSWQSTPACGHAVTPAVSIATAPA